MIHRTIFLSIDRVGRLEKRKEKGKKSKAKQKRERVGFMSRLLPGYAKQRKIDETSPFADRHSLQSGESM